MSAWQVLGSWFAVFLATLAAATIGVAWLRRRHGVWSRAVVWFLAAWFLLTGCLVAFFLSSPAVGDTICIGTVVDATHGAGDMSAEEQLLQQCANTARTDYVVGLSVYAGLVGAGALVIRRMNSRTGVGGSRRGSASGEFAKK